MKKRMIRVLLLTIFFLGIAVEVDAATVSASIEVSPSNTVVGNKGKATLTISSNEAIGQIYGTFTCGGLGEKDLKYSVSDSPSKSRTYTIDWTAKTAGTYTCTVKNLEVGTLETLDWPTVAAPSKTITVVKATSGGSSGGSGGSSSGAGGTTSGKKEYSSDNTLKSLSIDGYDLEPAFNKDTTEYRLTVDQSVEKIKVNATANDGKASITGTGEKSLSNGENTIEIKVTAENGNEKIYKLIVTVSDLNPISVNLGEEELTIVKKNNNLIEPLEYYNEITLNINDQEVVAYENTETNVTLVLLKNANNEINYYIYDKVKNTYTKYRYIKVGNVTLQLLTSNKIPENYQKYDLELQNEIIDFYKIKGSHKVGLIYGTNIKTGNTSYYVYDSNEETLSKYYNEEVKIYQDQIATLKNYLMIFVGGVALVTIIVIVSSLKRGHKKQINRHKL